MKNKICNEIDVRKYNLDIAFDKFDDDSLKEKIIKHHGFFSQKHYEFSKRFSSLLKTLNLTNFQFATKCGISTGSVSNYRTGKRIPEGDELEKIAKTLNITSDYLLGYTDCISYSAKEVNKMLGLSEKAMKSLFMILHDVLEVEDITDNKEISEVNKSKLKVFSKFIEDFPNFYKFLIYLEQYKKIQKEIEKTDDIDEDTKDTLYILERKILETIKTF